MADRPILFSLPMVRALLAGTKTQTRRILKPQPQWDDAGRTPGGFSHGAGWSWAGLSFWADPAEFGRQATQYVRVRQGDRLWVREPWKPGAWRDDARVAVDYAASPDQVHTPWIQLGDHVAWEDLWKRWTDELEAAGSIAGSDGIHRWSPGKSPLRWRPGIHMPRWASRLTLTVTDVRVQRLNEISEEDAFAEGVEPGFGGGPIIEDYLCLWNSIHGPFAADTNPWVAAYTFTVERRNIDAEARS